MTHQPPPGDPVASAGPDARAVVHAIQTGWIGRGFKLGIGFFLAGLVIWMIPMLLLVSCVGGIAALAGGAALDEAAEIAQDMDGDDRAPGESVAVQPAAEAARTAAEAAADTAASDAAAAAADET